MSKYTTEVRYICETAIGLTESAGATSIPQIIHACHSSVIGDYPIFDETYRETLNTKILKHYYTREIGYETVGLWKFKLNTKMNEIMPYYNQLYKSELLKFNPLYDVDYSDQMIRASETNGSSEGSSSSKSDSQSSDINSTSATASGQNSATSSSSNSASTEASSSSNSNKVQRDLYSDTPQGQINGLESGDYLTNARKIAGEEGSIDSSSGASSGTSQGSSSGSESSSSETNGSSISNGKANTESSSDSSSSSNTTENYIQRVFGKRGEKSSSKLLEEFRETFLNIDMKVIDELADLFMNIW